MFIFTQRTCLFSWNPPPLLTTVNILYNIQCVGSEKISSWSGSDFAGNSGSHYGTVQKLNLLTKSNKTIIKLYRCFQHCDSSTVFTYFLEIKVFTDYQIVACSTLISIFIKEKIQFFLSIILFQMRILQIIPDPTGSRSDTLLALSIMSEVSGHVFPFLLSFHLCFHKWTFFFCGEEVL